MSDDELLQRLARIAREEEDDERLDPRWEALAAGTLPVEEAEALRREAEESMQTKTRHDAFSPLGPEFRSRVVAAIREQHGKRAGTVAAAPEPEAPPRVSDIGAAHPRRPHRRWPRRRWAAAGLAAAALLTFALWPHGQPPLPGYAAHLAGGVQTMRAPADPRPAAGEAGEAVVFAPGNAFELVLTPAEPVRGRLTVATFVAPAGAAARPITLPAEVSLQGAVRIAGRVGGEVALPPGESDLLVAVGRAGRLPPPEELVERLAAGARAEGRGWVAWRLPVVLRPAGEAVEPP